jgi:ribosomal protein L13E
MSKPKVFKKDGKQRSGKGFSRGELKKAGVSLKEGLRLGISVDSRRRTAHKENVEVINALLKDRKAQSKSKRKSKS